MSLLRLTLCLLFAVFIGFVGCKEETNEPDEEQPTDGTDEVYIVGSLDGRATYWKDGVPVVLPSEHESQATDIFFDGNDMYVSGLDPSSTGTARAVYWKNGEAVYLTNGTNPASASAIVVINEDVYVVGSETLSGKAAAKLWKNGEETTLSKSGNEATADDIIVIDSDVFVLGSETEPDGFTYVKVWLNGMEKKYTQGSKAYGSRFYYDGTTIHIAGKETDKTTGKVVAKYWNGEDEVTLSDPDNYAIVSDILVKDGNVYVSGMETDAEENRNAKYWKNGEEVVLIVTQESLVSGLAFNNNNDLYAAGYVVDEEFNYMPVYWKNGKMVSLTEKPHYGFVNKIVIK